MRCSGGSTRYRAVCFEITRAVEMKNSDDLDGGVW